MAQSTTPKAPTGLTRRSTKFWRDAVGKYAFRIDELRILEEACREMDVIDRIQKAVDDSEKLTSKGSMGQEVAAPMIQELRHHRTTLTRLFSSLALPSEGESDSSQSRSAAARALASSRWHSGKAS